MKTDADTPRQPQRVRMSDGEKRVIKQAAATMGQRFSTFVREAALTAADETLDRRPSSGGRGVILTPSSVGRL